MDWKTVKLGDVCVVARGGSPRPINKYITEDENGVNWIKIGDTDTDSIYIEKTKERIIPEGVKKSRKVKSGDLLLTNSMSFGRPYILKTDGCIHDGWLVIHDESNMFDKEFLCYQLSSPKTYAKFKSMAVGGVVNNLNSKMVRALDVILPPVAEQIRIVEVLNKANQSISLRKQQIQLLDELSLSLYLEMFGDPIMNKKLWPIFDVEKVCSKIMGGGTPPKSIPEYYDGIIPWVTPKDMKSKTISDSIDHINNEAINNSSTKLIPKSSLLMVIRSGILKRHLPIAINAVDVAINQDMKAFIIDNEKVDVTYFYYFWKASEKFVLSKVRAVTADNIEFKQIKKMSIPVPPLDRQKEFAVKIEKIEVQKQLMKQSLTEMENNFNSLMQRAFKGELFN